MDTSDEWIRSRTGIEQRHIAAEDEFTSDLATKAAQAALDKAKLGPETIDLIIVATGTPDYSMPSTATVVQYNLGVKQGGAFDVAAACSGFVYGLTLTKSLIETGQVKRALVIGAETMSRLVDWEERGTCILFGDGAGAVIVEAQDGNRRGILAASMAADGSNVDILRTSGGVSTTQTAGVLSMNGQEVFRHAVDKMGAATADMAGELGYQLDDIDWFVPHQANARIITSIARKSKVSQEKFLVTLDKHANTSAASIPLALDVGVSEGKIKEGQLIATPALGAGLTWGCCIIEW